MIDAEQTIVAKRKSKLAHDAVQMPARAKHVGMLSDEQEAAAILDEPLDRLDFARREIGGGGFEHQDIAVGDAGCRCGR